nr:hypothetical protein CFP56_32476 [Quercus suber]
MRTGVLAAATWWWCVPGTYVARPTRQAPDSRFLLWARIDDEGVPDVPNDRGIFYGIPYPPRPESALLINDMRNLELYRTWLWRGGITASGYSITVLVGCGGGECGCHVVPA